MKMTAWRGQGRLEFLSEGLDKIIYMLLSKININAFGTELDVLMHHHHHCHYHCYFFRWVWLDLPIAQFMEFICSVCWWPGISPPDFDGQTLAVLRGRLVRYLMRSREVRTVLVATRSHVCPWLLASSRNARMHRENILIVVVWIFSFFLYTLKIGVALHWKPGSTNYLLMLVEFWLWFCFAMQLSSAAIGSLTCTCL